MIKSKSKIVYFFIVFCLICFSGFSQESNDHIKHDSHVSSNKGLNRITLGLGHTHVSEGQIDGDTKWLALASWSINYDHWFSEKLAVGLQNDIVLESFIIEHGDEELLERSYPVSSVPVFLYKPGKNLVILGGIGAEISQGTTLTMTRLGLEYGFHLSPKWEVGVTALWDGKWNYYNSWGLAFTFSRMWRKQN
jgi:hypothetical protein